MNSPGDETESEENGLDDEDESESSDSDDDEAIEKGQKAVRRALLTSKSPCLQTIQQLVTFR